MQGHWIPTAEGLRDRKSAGGEGQEQKLSTGGAREGTAWTGTDPAARDTGLSREGQSDEDAG